MRDDFTTPTKLLLAQRVGNRCSNPSCKAATSGPSDDGSAINVGVAAHITAAAVGGPRYDLSLSAEDRRSPLNGLWLCQNCAKLIDSDSIRFTAEVLRNWKGRAEVAALRALQATEVAAIEVARLERILDGHSNFVWDVTVTPDGRRVLSASNDRTVRMWDAATGNLLQTFHGHASFVCSLALSPAGDVCAAGAADGKVIGFKLSSGSQAFSLHHGAGDAKVSWSSSAARLASGGADGLVREWNLIDLSSDVPVRVHNQPILKLSYFEDDRLLSVSADRTIRLCDFSKRKCVAVFEGHTGEVNSVAVSPDKRWIVSASEDCTLRVWDTTSRTSVRTLFGHCGVVWRVAISSDGKLVASGAADNTVRLWSLTTGVFLQELRHPDCVAAVSFSPSGDRLVVGCDDSRVYVYGIGRPIPAV